MSSRIATLIFHDARLQRRYYIWAAYGIVVGLYAALLYFGGEAIPAWAAAMVIASDPAVLGFFFLGGLMLLEKAETARMALAMTPVSAADYLVAKTVTLTAVALIAVIALGLLMRFSIDWPVYLASVTLISIEFIGIGAALALRFKTVSGYLLVSGGLLLPLVLPGGFAFLENMPGWAAALPFAAPMRLLLVSLGGAEASLGDIATMLAIAAAYAAGGFAIGVVALQKEFGRK
jgi:fluoroquinolone transport system permease protein